MNARTQPDLVSEHTSFQHWRAQWKSSFHILSTQTTSGCLDALTVHEEQVVIAHTESDREAMANKKAKRTYEEDNQHLLGVPPHFALQADLFLCTDHSDIRIAFPVHRQLLSACSPVLGQVVFENLQTSAGSISTQDLSPKSLPVLPMIQDDPSAIRGVLRRIYSVYSANDAPSESSTDAAQGSLRTAPELTKQLALAHKYGMTKIASDIEAVLREALQSLFSQSIRASGEEPDWVLDCHTAAEKLDAIAELSAIGATLQDMCETIIAVNFKLFALNFKLDSKLSAASMLRVASKVFSIQRKTGEAIGLALRRCVTSAKEVSDCSSTFIASHVDFEQGETKVCPLCEGGLHTSTEYCQYAGDVSIVSHMQSDSRCVWPQASLRHKLFVRGPQSVKDFEGVQAQYAARVSNACVKAALAET